MRTRKPDHRKLIVEAAALGLGYSAFLIWVGSAFVGSFGDFDDGYPYWPAIPKLRTDTAGAVAFAVAIVTLVLSRYLQLRRGGRPPAEPASRPAGVHALQAVADTGVILGTGLVIYLSFNAAMHPWTLPLQLSHLAPWPSEGTVRVIALGVCLAGVAVRRYLRGTAVEAAAQPAAVEQDADQGPQRPPGGDWRPPARPLGGDMGGQQRFAGQRDDRNGGSVKLGHQPPWGTDYQ